MPSVNTKAKAKAAALCLRAFFSLPRLAPAFFRRQWQRNLLSDPPNPMASAAPAHVNVPTATGFHTTHWSVVLAAGRSDSPETMAALEWLCRAYWPPLYAFIRRSGHNPDAAKDLTQEFFAQVLTRNDFSTTSPEKGQFRSFLLAMLRHFLTNQWRRERCQKRGGGQVGLSL